ncbi:hypothetical protein [Pseudofrankia sp. BMG5.36]|uniref:hypothetical protein n=1 Tax=Pseudofrankia sp. BMG5.36 TaxID=1834512 RepID=UPI0008DAE972|nr:hypothetical protein [Pseudofrankia sp. BMG5.36]OHV63661.1 hypothetical protein BCD48_37810 [Pseudofrankia sp. BMG5.36]
MSAAAEFQRSVAETAQARTDDLLAVYADAYGAEVGDRKVTAFADRLARAQLRPGFEVAFASTPGAGLVGFTFGYPLPAGDTHWWVGLRPGPEAGFVVETGSRTFVLAEIEVRRAFQGGGVGRGLHDLLLAGRSEERATLAVNPAANTSHAIYRSWGWELAGQVPGSSGDYFDAYDLFVISLSSSAGRR